MTTGTRMPQRFVPQYDVKIRGGRVITEWRFGAHPTVHAVSPSGVPLVLRQKPQNGLGARTGVGDLVAPPGGGNKENSGNPGNFSVLPPIKDSGKRNENFSLSELDDISLKNEVLRIMKNIPDRGLQGMLANLRAQDRDRDGILSTDMVKGALRKFQLKLSEEGMKNLCKKFGEVGNHVTMVRYEDMVNYLAKARMEALRAPPPLPGQRAENTEESENQAQPMPPKQHPRKVNLRNRVLFSDKDEAQLIADMDRQLSGKPVNMADLRRTMYDLDRDRNDFLSGQQVEVAFSKCGVYLTPDVRARLLLATDRTGAGMYKIETLMNYLTRVKPETHFTVQLGNSHRPRQPRVGRHPMYQNQPTLNAPWELTQQQETNTQGEFLPDEGFSEEQQQRQRLQQLQEGHPLAPPPPDVPEETELPFDVQKWSSDYQYLAQAVYQADHDQSGYMPADEVQHITSTYNLVYNLQISEQTLLAALNTTTDENYGEVNLEYFIATLQDLHFRESGAY